MKYLSAVMLLAVLGVSSAQNLEAYRQMTSALDAAALHRPASKASSLSDLQRAQKALDSLKPEIRSSLLSQGLSDSLSAARASLSRSPADLEAQVTQTRGLMRAVLYGQTLNLLSGAPASAQSPRLQNQSRLLAEEFGLSGAASASFLKATGSANVAGAQRLLEQAAARKVQGYLGAVNLSDRPSAYLNLTRAASWFTAVQDAPAAGNLQVPQFAQALSALTSGDKAAARSSLATLKAGAARFVQASQRTSPANSAVLPPTPASPVSATPVPGSPVSADPVSGSPAPTTGTSTNNPAPAGRLPAQRRPAVSSTDSVYAALGRALAAAAIADQPTARSALVAASQALGASGRLGRAANYEALALDLNAASTRSGLRPSDVQALIGELSNAEALASGQPASALSASAAGAARSFGGGLRAALFFLLAALSAYPLYLLNLAFGNRNPYWRAILFGLLLLLLPALLEGLGGFLGFLGDVGGVGALRGLTNLSLTQNALGVPIWALSLLLALLSLTYGLRGLCVQFGLLGQGSTPQPETAGGLDWDEEI